MNLTSFLQDKRLTIALKGEIDHHSAKDTMRVVGNKIDLYLPVVCVLDFREVTFMDSSGIAIVISCVRRMRHFRHPAYAGDRRKGAAPGRSGAADEGAAGLRNRQNRAN